MIGHYIVLSELMARNMIDIRAYEESMDLREKWEPGRPPAPWDDLDESGKALAMISCRRYIERLEEDGIVFSRDDMPLEDIKPDAQYARTKAPYFDVDGRGRILDVMATAPVDPVELNKAIAAAELLGEKHSESVEWAGLALMVLPAVGIRIQGIEIPRINEPMRSVLGSFPGGLDESIYKAAEKVLVGRDGSSIALALESCITAACMLTESRFEFRRQTGPLNCDREKIKRTLYGGMMGRMERSRQFTGKRRETNLDSIISVIETAAADGYGLHDMLRHYRDTDFGYKIARAAG